MIKQNKENNAFCWNTYWSWSVIVSTDTVSSNWNCKKEKLNKNTKIKIVLAEF